jgi:nucleoside-diphosphate-sugar epimerase
MKIAILGATSQIAKDLVLSFTAHSTHELTLFARRPEVVTQWLESIGQPHRYIAAKFDRFDSSVEFDAIINFVGVGNPAQAKLMGASIFDVTLKYDQIALDYIGCHPACRYLFLSSGAVYGVNFDEAVNQHTKAVIPINHLQPQDWYGAAKLYAECRHRAMPDLPVIDIRVFSYFSQTQDRQARFLMCDILRAIEEKSILKTSADNLVRDYLHPDDFYQLVDSLLSAPAANAAIDCYSLAPIDKFGILNAMRKLFGLDYEIDQEGAGINATGNKPHYYSHNHRAAEFGYQPSMTSLAGIIKIMRGRLENKNKDHE